MYNEEVPPLHEKLLDLREELRTLEHSFQWFGLRHLDYTRPCGCKLLSDTDQIKCTRCFRIGYLFTDYLVKGYKWNSSLGFEFRTAAGDISTQRTNLVLKYNRAVNKFDHVLMLDSEMNTGRLVQPFKIARSFTVQDSMPLYGKEGRIEFWRCVLEERNIDDGQGNEGGTGFDYKGNRTNVEP